jgi:hypothetical protein
MRRFARVVLITLGLLVFLPLAQRCATPQRDNGTAGILAGLVGLRPTA